MECTVSGVKGQKKTSATKRKGKGGGGETLNGFFQGQNKNDRKKTLNGTKTGRENNCRGHEKNGGKSPEGILSWGRKRSCQPQGPGLENCFLDGWQFWLVSVFCGGFGGWDC